MYVHISYQLRVTISSLQMHKKVMVQYLTSTLTYVFKAFFNVVFLSEPIKNTFKNEKRTVTLGLHPYDNYTHYSKIFV